MTHFLHKDEVHPTFLCTKPYACVTVELIERNVLQLVRNKIGVIRTDAYLARLPERVKLVSPDGVELRREKNYLRMVSVETFDPFHALLDIPEEFLRWSNR